MSNNLPVKDPTADHVVADPGVEEHIERFTDVDEKAGNRAYRAILLMLGLVPVLAITNLVVYFAVPKHHQINIEFASTSFVLASAQNFLLGLTAGLAVLLIGLAVVQWARVLMNDHEMIEERHSASSDEETRAVAIEKWQAGVADSNIKRRPLILGALGGAVGMAALPAVVTLADMGPWPTAATRKETIEKTLFAAAPEKEVLLVNDETWRPIKASDLEIGQLVNAEPSNLHGWVDDDGKHHHEDALHGVEGHQAKAKAAIVIVRMDPNDIKIPESRKDWHVSGILAYSKICTHVGCPISLWERQTHHLLCPCHQSTFDLGNSGVVVFGPAARSLPQLPITVNADGYLVARGDFTVPVGPSYFERDSRNDYKDGDA
ncbi:ubiquinol-cytochrome c reductase iron-sulfur subunit [Tessaracoccus sp. OH4464_COT-324]|uniref:cytochrome bc1 complex Rieske iron-sulfur subunit n=1 Tax=Tessaracoccus sp. OH4464_COT-324 TaxID=2491059 RepID=UPI000F642A1E|nr:Rieske 2Fe-2S domain-containing protein [Tessaracoccus sp. OH4464_COT-324]RRD45757.1 Rieske (2Fe-2S) protein [Tessaracoccus sp. OH4464_COT-324]